jgi:hypothetical protein
MAGRARRDQIVKSARRSAIRDAMTFIPTSTSLQLRIFSGSVAEKTHRPVPINEMV